MKNAFEIRAEMLAMAKDYLDATYKAQVEAAMEMAKASDKALADANIPTMYSMEDVVTKASELYKFVQTKD